MKKSLFAKSLGGYLLIIILLSVLILFFSFRTIREYYIESLTGDLTHLCLYPGDTDNLTGGGKALPGD